MEFSIVVPAYNEEDKITSSLTQIINFMRSFSSSFEVLVIDDGSKDTTAQKVEEYIKENPEIKLCRNPHKGKAFAVWTGMMDATGDYIYMADADLSAPIEELKKLFVWMKDQNFDLVIGSREGIGARRIGEPLYRHLMGRIFNYWVQLIALPGINDSQCGFKLFKKKAAKDIFNKLIVYGGDTKEIKSVFYGAWDVEVLYLARKMGYTIKQVPVTWSYVKEKKFNRITSSIKMACDVLKVRFNDLRGKYKTARRPDKSSK